MPFVLTILTHSASLSFHQLTAHFLLASIIADEWSILNKASTTTPTKKTSRGFDPKPASLARNVMQKARLEGPVFFDL
jgi:hypothetical protein